MQALSRRSGQAQSLRQTTDGMLHHLSRCVATQASEHGKLVETWQLVSAGLQIRDRLLCLLQLL